MPPAQRGQRGHVQITLRLDPGDLEFLRAQSVAHERALQAEMRYGLRLYVNLLRRQQAAQTPADPLTNGTAGP